MRWPPGWPAASATSRTLRLAWEPQANEVFAIMSDSEKERLTGKGAVFFGWHTPQFIAASSPATKSICRFVTSFATTAEDVDALGDLIA